MKLAIHLVTWNGAKFIPSLFASLRNQKLELLNAKLLVLDNGSTDGTVEPLKKGLVELQIPYELIEGRENLGFAGGHNLLFRKTDAEFVLLLNQDLYLEPECIQKLLEAMEQHQELAAVTPRLMRWNMQESEIINPPSSRAQAEGKSEIIDSLGLKIFRSRRVVDEYSGFRIYDLGFMIAGLRPVFGVSGTCPMFRMSALRDVAFADGTIFDQSYGSYKEDVDLAWRLQSAGFEAGVVLEAVAYHARGSGQVLGEDDWSAMKNKQMQSPFIKKFSYRNHLATIYKNDTWQNGLLDWPWIVWYEGKKFAYFLLFDRTVLTGITEIWQHKQELREKRAWINGKRKTVWKKLRQWWSNQKS